MGLFETVVAKLVDLLKYIGAVALAGMMLLTCADVLLRGLGHPILGAIELVGFLATLVLSCAMPYTHQVQGHIGVDLLVRKFAERKRLIIEVFTGALALFIFALVGWQTTVYGNVMRDSGEVSMTLEIPFYALIYFISFCFLVLCAVIFIETYETSKKAIKL